jgi:site-specific recombinase XerC
MRLCLVAIYQLPLTGLHWMFPHTRVRGPSLYYFRKIGGRVVEVRIGRLSEGEAVLRQRYQELLQPTPRTVGDLLTAWAAEEHDLAPRTLKEYRRHIQATLLPVFDKTPMTAMHQGIVAQYLQRRGNVSANREIACLSTVFEWGMRHGFAAANPCRGVRRNKERARERDVSNRELGQAMRKAPPEFRDFLLAAYLTGFRQGDLRSLRRDQVGRLGMELTESKNRRRVKMAWSHALRRLITRCERRNDSEYVFTNTDGEPWSLWAVQSAMRRLDVDWTYHDLRRKAESDHPVGLGLLARYKRAWDLRPTR